VTLEVLLLSHNQLDILPESDDSLDDDGEFHNESESDDEEKGIVALANLEKLDLSHNNLRFLPSSLGDLQYLKHLDVSYNQLKFIPDSVGELFDLEFASFHHNQIEAIPQTLGECDGLEELYFSHNIIAEIPQTLFLLSSLTVLTLSHNRISVLPDYFPSFKALQVLSLSGNLFKKEDIKKKIVEHLLAPRNGGGNSAVSIGNGSTKKTLPGAAAHAVGVGSQKPPPLLWVSVGKDNRDPPPESFFRDFWLEDG